MISKELALKFRAFIEQMAKNAIDGETLDNVIAPLREQNSGR